MRWSFSQSWNCHILNALKTLRVYFPTLTSKGVIAIFQYVLPWLSIIRRHHHTNASPHCCCCCFASRHARINPNFNCCSGRVRTHMHTRVNCATLMFWFPKYINSVGWVIQNPERMDKSDLTISMRWSFFMNCHDREHFATVIIEASTHGRYQRPPNTLLDCLILSAYTKAYDSKETVLFFMNIMTAHILPPWSSKLQRVDVIDSHPNTFCDCSKSKRIHLSLW